MTVYKLAYNSTLSLTDLQARYIAEYEAFLIKTDWTTKDGREYDKICTQLHKINDLIEDLNDDYNERNKTYL